MAADIRLYQEWARKLPGFVNVVYLFTVSSFPHAFGMQEILNMGKVGVLS